jgi:hypothetical protein
MCYFITTTLPPGSDVAAVRALAAPEGSRWVALSNPHVRAQLPQGWVYYALTGAVCDCDSSLVPRDATRGKRLELPRHAAAWSETKRVRWLEQRRALVERAESDAHGDATGWHEYLKAVLRAAGKKPLGLLIHFYRHGVENEEIALERRVSVKVRAMPPTALQTLEPDVLYEFS